VTVEGGKRRRKKKKEGVPQNYASPHFDSRIGPRQMGEGKGKNLAIIPAACNLLRITMREKKEEREEKSMSVNLYLRAAVSEKEKGKRERRDKNESHLILCWPQHAQKKKGRKNGGEMQTKGPSDSTD